ncbi:CHAD domain-containing protein [Marinovum sp.]|uniref:CHAD domain-containing protein n=1 Tax=Marinovum sp. TaxID=2024839 RepID=UPI002B274A21|nr:CHAD domain-containing protein [Marinovum sp.]
MGYKFKSSDADVTEAVRRIAREQLGRALDALDGSEDKAEAVHDARKRCKKLRGLIRLVRPQFEDYKAENRALRDAARRLADLRESGAALEILAQLEKAYPERLSGPNAATLRATLEARRTETHLDDFEARRAAFRADLLAVRRRAKSWEVEKSGFGALKGGLKKTYKRARKTWATALETRDPKDLHQWRKRVKYHWYHARLLKPLASETRIAQLDQLSDLLGDHQDLADLQAMIAAGDLPPAAAQALVSPLAIEMNRLQNRAFALAPKVLGAKPKKLVKRYRKGWKDWRD